MDESSSDLEQAAVREWAGANKLSADTLKILLKEGFITMEALMLVEEGDFNNTKMARGQVKLLVQKVRESRTVVSSEVNNPQAAANPEASGQSSEGLGPIAGQSGAHIPGMTLSSLGSSDPYLAQGFLGLLGQAGFGATPVDYSWQNPEVYLANAAGKSSEFLDICDFVAAQCQLATEKVLVQKEGGSHLVLKSGPRKPRLGTTGLEQ
jgi:hypothetical protein